TPGQVPVEQHRQRERDHEAGDDDAERVLERDAHRAPEVEVVGQRGDVVVEADEGRLPRQVPVGERQDDCVEQWVDAEDEEEEQGRDREQQAGQVLVEVRAATGEEGSEQLAPPCLTSFRAQRGAPTGSEATGAGGLRHGRGPSSLRCSERRSYWY